MICIGKSSGKAAQHTSCPTHNRFLLTVSIQPLLVSATATLSLTDAGLRLCPCPTCWSGGLALPPPPPLHRNAEPPVSDTPPSVGSIHRGTVHTIKPFGLFIAIPGYRRHVLVHHSQVWFSSFRCSGFSAKPSKHCLELLGADKQFWL